MFVEVRHFQAQVDLACTIALAKYVDLRKEYRMIQESTFLEAKHRLNRPPSLIQMGLLSLNTIF